MSIQGFDVSTSPHPESLTPPPFGTTGDASVSRKITYPGMNNKTDMTYGPTGERVKIVETVSGSVTSTKQFVGGEERDGSGNVTKQFFSRGQRNGSTNYFFGKDQLGSVRTMTDNSGILQASYSFDPYGRTSKLEGSVDSDFGFAGMYVHARSGLSLAAFRAYNPMLGRWISRDPIEEEGGMNLFAYVNNAPIGLVDLSGLDPIQDMAKIEQMFDQIVAELVALHEHEIDGAWQDIIILKNQNFGLKRKPLTGCTEQASYTVKRLKELMEKAGLLKNWNVPEYHDFWPFHAWVEVHSKDGGYWMGLDPFTNTVDVHSNK